MSIQLKDFRPFKKNSLQGFITLYLPGAGLEIRDCSLFEKDERRWVSLPSRSFQKDDGTTAWANVVSIPDEDRYQKFQNETIKALDVYLSKNESKEAELTNDDIPF